NDAGGLDPFPAVNVWPRFCLERAGKPKELRIRPSFVRAAIWKRAVDGNCAVIRPCPRTYLKFRGRFSHQSKEISIRPLVTCASISAKQFSAVIRPFVNSTLACAPRRP